MMRFFTDTETLKSGTPALLGENFKHAKVLRLKVGEEVTLCDGECNEAVCIAEEITSEAVFLKVVSRKTSENEPIIKTSVFMALPKADKLEHVIQKATELGAYEIITFPTSRCIAKLDNKTIEKKLERWQKIAESAAKQSMRGYIPKVRYLNDYKTALEEAAKADMPLFFYENERSTTLKMALNSKEYKTVSILTGPEGGFSEQEVESAIKAGLKVCTLGKRILRCETAPLCALSAIMFDSGEF